MSSGLVISIFLTRGPIIIHDLTLYVEQCQKTNTTFCSYSYYSFSFVHLLPLLLLILLFCCYSFSDSLHLILFSSYFRLTFVLPLVSCFAPAPAGAATPDETPALLLLLIPIYSCSCSCPPDADVLPPSPAALLQADCPPGQQHDWTSYLICDIWHAKFYLDCDCSNVICDMWYDLSWLTC